MKNLHKLIYALILSLVYFFLVMPLSGILGGIVLIFIGWFTPSVVNLLVSSYVVSNISFIQKRTHKIISFILMSFLLGINTYLLIFIVGYKPRNVRIEIIQPLRKIVSSKIYISDEWISLKAEPLSFYSFGVNEGCCCSYFMLPSRDVLSSQSWLNLLNDENVYYNQYTPTKDPNDKDIAYVVNVNHTKDFFNYNVTTSIEDKFGGKIMMHASYPRWLSVDTYYVELSKDTNFWGHAWNEFLHSNFWTLLLNYAMNYPEATIPFDKLGPNYKEKIFAANTG